MQQNSFDDTIFLGEFSHLDKVRVRIFAVRVDDVSHPRCSSRSIRSIIVLIEQLNFAASDRNIHNTNSDLLRKVDNYRSTKIIGRAKASGAAAQRRDGRIPMTIRSA